MLKLWMKPAGSWRCPFAIASQGGLADGTGAMRKEVAGATGLEPATSAVTGQRSNQLSYAPAGVREGLNAAFRQVKNPAQAFVSTAVQTSPPTSLPPAKVQTPSQSLPLAL